MKFMFLINGLFNFFLDVFESKNHTGEFTESDLCKFCKEPTTIQILSGKKISYIYTF